jgi:hypothetical protein
MCIIVGDNVVEVFLNTIIIQGIVSLIAHTMASHGVEMKQKLITVCNESCIVIPFSKNKV